MTRDDGWRFLSLGRHLERLHFVSSTLGDVAPEQASAGSGLLEWLLELSDSLLTYRVRHMQQPEWESVVDLMLFDERNPRSAQVPAGQARQARPAAAGCRPDRRAGGGRSAARTTAASDVDADQGELFGRGERRLEALLTGCQRVSCGSAPRSRSATSATWTTCRARRSAYERRAVSHRARDALRPRRRRVDVAARGVSDAAHAAAPARALARAGDRAGAGQPRAADRLLRQHRRPVHDPDAVRRDVRGRPQRRRGDRDRAADRARRRRAVGSGARRALLPARRAVRRRRGVQLSVAVRRHGAGAGRVRARVVRAAVGRSSRRPST